MIQSVSFPRTFTSIDARRWLKRNNLIPIKRVDKTNNFLRYRIQNPKDFNRFSILKAKGVNLTLGHKSETPKTSGSN